MVVVGHLIHVRACRCLLKAEDETSDEVALQNRSALEMKRDLDMPHHKRDTKCTGNTSASYTRL